MPVTVKINYTTSTPSFVAIIPDATPKNDGVMTKEQAAALKQMGGMGQFDGVNLTNEPLGNAQTIASTTLTLISDANLLVLGHASVIGGTGTYQLQIRVSIQGFEGQAIIQSMPVDLTTGVVVLTSIQAFTTSPYPKDRQVIVDFILVRPVGEGSEATVLAYNLVATTLPAAPTP